jgi:hypothetical protein
MMVRDIIGRTGVVIFRNATIVIFRQSNGDNVQMPAGMVFEA